MNVRSKVKSRAKTSQSQVKHMETSPQESDIADVSHLTPDSVLNLQSLIGNQAVQRLIAQKSPVQLSMSPSSLIQRQAYGLENQGSVGRYTDRAAKIWHNQPTMSLRDFVFTMMNLIANELDAIGVPPCGWTLDKSLGHDGKFDQKKWHMFINPGNFSANSNPKVVQDLTEDEIQSVVGTLYHEARHADQDFLVARMLAGKGHKANEIVAKMQIPIEIAEEAINKKLVKSSANKDQVAHAEIMFETMYGDYKAVLQFIMDFGARLQDVALAAQAVTQVKLSDGVTKVDALLLDLNNWSQATLQNELVKLGKKKNKNSLDHRILKELKSLDNHLTLVSRMRQKITKPSVQNIQALGDKLYDFFMMAFKAYKSLESEADAFRVEKGVQQQFKKKI